MMTSTELFERCRAKIPGGVNSPVRAFGAVGMEPRFIQRAEGAYLIDVEGNRYLDYVGSWGPMILGHAHPAVLEAVEKAVKDGLSFGAPCVAEERMAEQITSMAPVEMVRMVSSGTEAVMSALRLARGYTGRNKIIKFTGCYHGHCDSMLVSAGSGALTGGVPSSAGVPLAVVEDTLLADYNDLEMVRTHFASHPDSIAAVIVEPVAANMGVIPPCDDFLSGLRALCSQYGALLIFDEVITGFRLAGGGAQQYYGIGADLVTYGKIVGGGMPVGAYGGRKEIMERVAPLGPVYQAGTLSGNPVTMAAGLAQLQVLEKHPELYAALECTASKLEQGILQIAGETGAEIAVNRVGSLCCIFFTTGPVDGYRQAMGSNTGAYARYFASMLEQGIYLAPSQFEAMFISTAHSDEHIRETLHAMRNALT